MAIRVTENWSGQSLALRWPFVAVREFVVSGTDDVGEAVTATGVPQEGDAHPFNTYLVALPPQIKEVKGPEYFVVTVLYQFNEKGHASGELDPLIRPPKIAWRSLRISELFDVDVIGRPIVNSVGDALDPMPRDVLFWELTLTKHQPYFDIALAEQFANSVNKDPVTLASNITVDAEHMLCDCIEPVSDFYPNAPVVEMMFRFHVFFSDALGQWPFQHHVMDRGTQAWYVADGGTTKKIGKITMKHTGRWEIVNDPVALDGSGKVLASRNKGDIYRVTEAGKAIVSPSASPSPMTPQRYKSKEFKFPTGTAGAQETHAFQLVFQRVRVVDFAPLLSLFTIPTP